MNRRQAIAEGQVDRKRRSARIVLLERKSWPFSSDHYKAAFSARVYVLRPASELASVARYEYKHFLPSAAKTLVSRGGSEKKLPGDVK